MPETVKKYKNKFKKRIITQKKNQKMFLLLEQIEKKGRKSTNKYNEMILKCTLIILK